MGKVISATARLSCGSALSFAPHPLAPTRQRQTVKHQCMLEKLLAAEVLEVLLVPDALFEVQGLTPEAPARICVGSKCVLSDCRKHQRMIARALPSRSVHALGRTRVT
jgi:hypothetical protein